MIQNITSAVVVQTVDLYTRIILYRANVISIFPANRAKHDSCLFCLSHISATIMYGVCYRTSAATSER